MSKEGILPEGIKTLDKYFDIEDITQDGLKTLVSNYLMISPNEAIIDRRNKRLGNLLNKYGITPYELDFSEVTKLWGAFRCTTLPLYRS